MYVYSEKDQLIQRDSSEESDDSYKEKRGKSTIPVKYAIIIPAVVLVVLAAQIHMYVVNEWTQYEIRTTNMPNMSSISDYIACEDTNHSTDEYTQYKTVQQTSATWIALYSVALHVPAFFSNLVLPCYTDTYGRRFLFILSAFGLVCRCGIMAIIIYFKMSYFYVIGIYAMDGLLGSSYALYTMCYSYIADITRADNQRVLGLVFIQLVIMAATVCSSVLSGYMIETWQLHYFYTSLISVLIGFVGFFIFAFMLPESLAEKQRQEQQSFIGTVKRSINFYLTKEADGMTVCYLLLLLAFAFSELSGTVNRASIETLYFLGQPFCWGPSKIGMFQMTRHATQGILGLGSVKLFQKIMSHEAISIVSALSTTTSFIIEAYASSTLMVYMVTVAGILGFLLSPLIRAMMSTITPASKQGSMFAGMIAIQIISSITASFADDEIYAATMSNMTGFVFLIMAAFGLLDIILLITFCCVKPYKSLGAKHIQISSEHDTAF